ncbi:MAG: DUF6894 family protein [Allosphingosinicella sp.]
MPRYFFNIRNDLTVDDDEGTQLEDEAAAREVALESARALVCESVKVGHLNLDHFIEVLGENRDLLFKLTFREAFTIADGHLRPRRLRPNL